MKYRLGGTITCAPFPISLFSTRCGRVRTEESDSYVHPYVHCVNGLGQNADCYVNLHGVDSLIGAHNNSHLRVFTEQMHKPSWHPFYTSEGSYYLILYTQSSVGPFAISCVHNFVFCFHRNSVYLKFTTMVPSRFGTRSILHPVSLTFFGRFDPYFGQLDPQFFFCNKWLFYTPFIFLVPNIEQKKNVFLFAQYVVNISILLFFLQYIVKSTSSPMFMFTFFVLLLQIHYHLDTYSGGIVFADIGNNN